MTANAPCADCRVDTLPTGWHQDAEYYNVHDHVWTAAGMDRGHLCIGCLEARLGRHLNPDDFTDAPINDPDAHRNPTLSRKAWAWRTPRMMNRLVGPDERQLTLDLVDHGTNK